MKRLNNKSDCPINLTVELFGDQWSLLILRDILGLGKKTYGEFMNSTERIGPSVLAEKLVSLETAGLITKTTDAKDKRRIIYTPTSACLDVIPILYETAIFGTQRFSSPDDPDPWLASVKFEKALVIDLWRQAILNGDSFMFGEKSVAVRLKLF